jgi:hypothetical protein
MARAYLGFKDERETPSGTDKWFGDDRLPAEVIAERCAPPLSDAPADVQEMFRLSMSRRTKKEHVN